MTDNEEPLASQVSRILDRQSSLKLECYDLATKATPEPHIDEVLDEAKRLYDWVTGRDEPVSAADGSEDLGRPIANGWGSSQPAEYPVVG